MTVVTHDKYIRIAYKKAIHVISESEIFILFPMYRIQRVKRSSRTTSQICMRTNEK